MQDGRKILLFNFIYMPKDIYIYIYIQNKEEELENTKDIQQEI